MSAGHFGSRLRAAVERHGRLCVGIDPHEALLADWGLSVDAAGARELALRTVEAAAGRVAVVKPQVALFEQFGPAGFAVLAEVLADARAAGLLVIADAKRGDIGSTMAGYARAWLSPGGALESDALTVNPYLGVGALEPAIALAHEHGKGLFVLAATSNAEATELQRSRDVGGATVAAQVYRAVQDVDTASTPAGEWGSIGVVIGATVQLQTLGLHQPGAFPVPILAPGFGAQGADLGDLATVFGAAAPYVLASESRGILQAGAGGLVAAIESRTAALEGADD